MASTRIFKKGGTLNRLLAAVCSIALCISMTVPVQALAQPVANDGDTPSTNAVLVEALCSDAGIKTALDDEKTLFTVFAQKGAHAEKEVARVYTDSMFKALESGGDPVSGMFFKSDVWNVVTAARYVTMSDLFTDAGIGDLWTSGASLIWGGDDPASPEKGAQTLAYDTLMTMNKFYPKAAGAVCNEPDNYIVEEPVISITEYSCITGTTDAPDAESAVQYNVEHQNVNNYPRNVWGINSAWYSDEGHSLARGMYYWNRNSYFTVVGAGLGDATVTGVGESYGYTGRAITPEPTVVYNGKTLVKDVDYTIEYSDNIEVGTAKMKIVGIGSYDGTGNYVLNFEIEEASAPAIDVTMYDAFYTGYAVTSGLTVTSEGQTLSEGTDYTAEFKDNVEVGTATVTVTGTGAYAQSDQVVRTFAIKHASMLAVFTDLDATAWYLSEEEGVFAGTKTLYLDFVLARGLMSGYAGSTEFGPEKGVTREQFATILFRYANPDRIAETTDPTQYAKENLSGLSDVYGGQYYTAAVNWAVEKGIITGYAGEGRFGTGDPIQREQLATMVYRFCTVYKGLPDDQSAALDFTDAASISDWAEAAVKYCYAKGIVSGDSATHAFMPQGNAARTAAAKMIAVTARDVVEVEID